MNAESRWNNKELIIFHLLSLLIGNEKSFISFFSLKKNTIFNKVFPFLFNLPVPSVSSVYLSGTPIAKKFTKATLYHKLTAPLAGWQRD